MDKELIPVFSVSEYCEVLNATFKELGGKIVGEVTEMKVWSSGHVYFSLKDEEDESVLSCVMWKFAYRVAGIQLEDGMKIMVTGHPNIYKKSGRMSVVCDMIELVGEGALKKRYDELRAKLDGEGLFDPSRKRELPPFPQKIGVITSARGAVIHDFQSNLGKFGFSITFIDSLVEGAEAIQDLLASVRTMKKQDIDVLVVMRGGGSLQSLAAFDNEMLVRELVDFPVPVIAAIGHHQDIPLVALAADVTVSTPTAAAHILNKPWEQVVSQLSLYTHHIFHSFEKILQTQKFNLHQFQSEIFQTYKEILHVFEKSTQTILSNFYRMRDSISQNRKDLSNVQTEIFKSFQKSIRQAHLQTSGLWTELGLHYDKHVKLTHTTIKNFDKIIHLNNPERQLRLGYSITSYNGKVLKSIQDVRIGVPIDVRISDGTIASNVTRIKKGGSTRPA